MSVENDKEKLSIPLVFIRPTYYKLVPCMNAERFVEYQEGEPLQWGNTYERVDGFQMKPVWVGSIDIKFRPLDELIVVNTTNGHDINHKN